jgi:hypothetical protein
MTPPLTPEEVAVLAERLMIAADGAIDPDDDLFREAAAALLALQADANKAHADALEEAATLCEDWPDSSGVSKQRVWKIAAAIRALAASEKEKR